MDVLGNAKERHHVAQLLKRKYGSHEKAAAKMGISKFTLSRILNGRNGELPSLVAILQAAGLLEKRKYRMPADDLSTFYFLNGIMDVDLTGGQREHASRGSKKPRK